MFNKMMSKIIERGFDFRKNYWLLPLTIWILLYSFRPFILGFYSDDWSILLLPSRDERGIPLARFSYFIGLYANRPLTGIFTYLLSLFCNDSPFLWHTVITFINLATTFSIRLFIRRFLELIDSNSLFIADILAVFWLALPWTMGFTLWPTIVPCQSAIICFSYSGIFLFEAWRKGNISWFKPALFFLLSCLTYESFYGQFVILIGISLIYGIPKKLGVKAILYPLIGFIIAQAMAISWNRISGIILRSNQINKTLYSGWYTALFQSVVHLPNTLLRSTSVFKIHLIYLISMLLSFFIISILWQSNQLKILKPKIKLLLTIFLFSLGGAIALSVYALAGYGMASIGISSRVTLSLSFWLIMILVPIYLILWQSPKPLKLATTIVTVAIVICLSSSQVIQVRAWAKSWEIQQSVLASEPIYKMSKINQKAYVVLTKFPDEYQGITVFGSSWDLDAAIKYYAYPNLQKNHFLVDTEAITTSWNGNIVKQSLKHHWSFEFKLSENQEVWIWDDEIGTLEQASAPFQL